MAAGSADRKSSGSLRALQQSPSQHDASLHADHAETASMGSSELMDDDPLAAYLGTSLPSNRPTNQSSLRTAWSSRHQHEQGEGRSSSGLNLSDLLGPQASDSHH